MLAVRLALAVGSLLGASVVCVILMDVCAGNVTATAGKALVEGLSITPVEFLTAYNTKCHSQQYS